MKADLRKTLRLYPCFISSAHTQSRQGVPKNRESLLCPLSPQLAQEGCKISKCLGRSIELDRYLMEFFMKVIDQSLVVAVPYV